MSEHTKEPWEAFTLCPGECCWHLRTVTNDEHDCKEEISSPEMSGENARRIVACVNACAGTTTDELEEMVKAGGNITDLADFADDLLMALNRIASWGEGEIGGHMDEPVAAGIARAAIAYFKGAES